MKRIVLALVALVIASTAQAASFTVTYTAAQDTVIQTRVIPAANTAKCATFRLGPSCTSANLVTNGCVTAVFPSKNLRACVIYTLDATGEGLFLQDESNRALVERFILLNNIGADIFIAACRGRTAAQQDQICVDAGLASGCNPCP